MSFPSYPEYKTSGVKWLGEVPVNWVLTPIKHLALLNPRKSGFDGDTEQLCSFVPMEKLKTGVVQLDEERPIAEVIGGYTYFEDGDVLQAKVTPCFENRNIAIAKGLTNGIGFGSSEINVLRPYQEVSAEFLYYRVQEDSYMSFCTSSMIGAGGLKRVPTDVINNFKIAAPELFEQTQIARFLDHETARIDALIEEQQRLIELLKEKRQAVISHAVTKGLDPTGPMKDSGVEWLGEVPAHWRHNYKLGAMADASRGGFVNGPFGSDLLSSELTREGVPVVYIRDVKPTGYFRKSTDCVTEEKARQLSVCRVLPGDVLVAKVGSPPGDACIYPSSEPDGIVTQDVVRIRVNPEVIDAEYLVFLLNSHFGITVVDSISVESTRKRFSLGDYKQLKLPLPPLAEQTQIARTINTQFEMMDALLLSANEGVLLIQERRSALISAAVTGKIDVRGWQPPTSATSPELAQEAV